MALPDSGWIKALEMKVTTTLAIGVIGLGIFAAAELKIAHVDELLPPWGSGIAAITGASATVLGVSHLVSKFIQHARAFFARKKRQRRVLDHLDSLSESEQHFLAEQLHLNQRAFVVSFFDKTGKLLISRGLIAMSPGTHPTGQIPCYIPEFVWWELQLRRAEILGPFLVQDD